MGKVRVEFCIVSARGLHRSSLWNWKPQWFAVAWVDPTNKYCTRMDGSGNPNPVWRTKFSAEVDSDSDDCALHVEVYSRDPLFLLEKLYASAEVSLKLHDKVLDLGSFQLRRKGSNKPMGFVDVSWRTELDVADGSTAARDKEGFQLQGNNSVISLAREPGGVVQATPVTPQALHQVPFTHPNPAPLNYTYTHPTPYPSNYNNPSLGGPTYPPATGPTYPPPPSHSGYVPTFHPRVDTASTSYLNLQPSARGAGGIRPGFAAGIGAGALAAGAVIFGDDVISGFDLSSGLHHPSLNLSIDPPF